MEVNIVMSKVLTSKLSSPYSDCKKEYLFEPKPLDLLNNACFRLCLYSRSRLIRLRLIQSIFVLIWFQVVLHETEIV